MSNEIKESPLTWDEVYKENKDMIIGHVNRFVSGPEREDVLQNVYLALFKSLSSFSNKSAAASWVRGVTRNIVAESYRKKRKRNRTIFDSDIIPDMPGVSDPVSDLSVKEIVRDVLPEHRDILWKYSVEGYTSGEIANLYGVSDNAIRMRLKDLRKRYFKLEKESQVNNF